MRRGDVRSVSAQVRQQLSVHKPVMTKEVVAALDIRPGGCYVDGTLGGGGHAQAILEAMAGKGRLLGLDRDGNAVATAAARLEQWKGQCRLEQRCFSGLEQAVAAAGWKMVDGALLDLGLSSDQLAAPERGFSFSKDGPLDMRMDAAASGRTAADLVNELPAEELERIFREYGEEPGARRVAKAIVEARSKAPLRATGVLAALVAGVLGSRRNRRIHPATRVFQALRIAVNHELEELESTLETAIKLLAPGGRLVVLSYHSLEDRLVKACFRNHAGRRESLPAGGWQWVGQAPPVRLLQRRAQKPSELEVQANPRARSAKLRAVERMGCS